MSAPSLATLRPHCPASRRKRGLAVGVTDDMALSARLGGGMRRAMMVTRLHPSAAPASTARPCLVMVSPPATSRSSSPLITVVVTVARVMPARSQPVRLPTQNSRRRAGMLSTWACAAGLSGFGWCHAASPKRSVLHLGSCPASARAAACFRFRLAARIDDDPSGTSWSLAITGLGHETNGVAALVEEREVSFWPCGGKISPLRGQVDLRRRASSRFSTASSHNHRR